MPTFSALITGGSGFIGSHLVERLVSRRWPITLVDKAFSKEALNHKADLNAHDAIEGDISTLVADGQVDLSRFDYIFHLSGSSNVLASVAAPMDDLRSNLLVTMTLLEALRNCSSRPKFIYVSSAAVYGNPARMPIGEDDPTVPISPYGASKLATERYASVYNKLYGVPVAILRPFSVYGPGQRKQVIHDLLKQLQANPAKLDVRGDGTQARDFIYIDDMIDALITIAEKAKFDGDVYNVASGRSVTINELVATIVKASGTNPQIKYSGDGSPGEPLRWSVDISKLRALGFHARVSLKDGIERFNSHLVAQGRQVANVEAR